MRLKASTAVVAFRESTAAQPLIPQGCPPVFSFGRLPPFIL
jgi:hypothetical protein